MLNQMKENIQKANSIEQELNFTKQNLLDARVKERALAEENKKMMEMFV